MLLLMVNCLSRRLEIGLAIVRLMAKVIAVAGLRGLRGDIGGTPTSSILISP